VIPRAAVVIPAHNGERHLDAALRSLRDQTIDDIEIIVVDDGSTDRTPAIACSHARDDTRVRVLRTNAGSAGAARNVGWRASRAPFVANLDQDDLAEPHRLETQLAFLEAHPRVGLVGGAYAIIDDAGRVRGTISTPAAAFDVTARVRSGDLGPVTHATATFRREALEEADGYREFPGTSVEDVDLYARIAEHWQIANVADRVGSWRIHGANSSLGVATMARWELLVEAAARERREGRADPLADRDLRTPPKDDELLALGYSSAKLRARRFWWHLAWVSLLVKVRELDAASQELAAAAAAASDPSSDERAALLAARAQLELAMGHRAQAVATVAAAALRSPRRAAKSLAHPIAGRVGRTAYGRLPRVRAVRWARDTIVARLNQLSPDR
jgi:glycosyltransferase involved in cell wall biosynthesis